MSHPKREFCKVTVWTILNLSKMWYPLGMNDAQRSNNYSPHRGWKKERKCWRMPTILKDVSLDMLLFNAQFALTGVTPRYKYADEKRTDELEGYVYKVTDLTSLNPLAVFVPRTKPIISSDEVDRTNANGERIFVEFDDAVITPYVAKRSGTIEDSIKATNVRLVKED